MISFRSVIRFIILFFIAYAVLLTPQTGIKRMYAELLCSQGNEVFKNIENDRLVILKPQKENKNNDIVLILKFILRPSGEVKESKYNIDTGVIGYLPLVLFLSLVTATPLRWKRKIFAFILGYIIMTIFILLRIRVLILCGLILSTGTGINYDEATKESITFWYDYFVVPITIGYIFALILWIGLCMGKKEYQKLNGKLSEIVANKKTTNKNRHNKTGGRVPDAVGRRRRI